MMFSGAGARSNSIYVSHGSAQEGNTILCSSYETHGRVFLTYAGRFVYVTSIALARCQAVTCFFVNHCYSLVDTVFSKTSITDETLFLITSGTTLNTAQPVEVRFLARRGRQQQRLQSPDFHSSRTSRNEDLLPENEDTEMGQDRKKYCYSSDDEHDEVIKTHMTQPFNRYSWIVLQGIFGHDPEH